MMDWDTFRRFTLSVWKKHGLKTADDLGFYFYPNEDKNYCEVVPSKTPKCQIQDCSLKALRAKLLAGDPLINDIHVAVTKARLLGFEVRGWP